MQQLKDLYDWFLNLTPTKKNNLFSILIISGLCYVIYYTTNEYKEKYGKLFIEYNNLDRRCDSIVNAVNEKRQADLQKYTDKFEELFK